MLIQKTLDTETGYKVTESIGPTVRGGATGQIRIRVIRGYITRWGLAGGVLWFWLTVAVLSTEVAVEALRIVFTESGFARGDCDGSPAAEC